MLTVWVLAALDRRRFWVRWNGYRLLCARRPQRWQALHVHCRNHIFSLIGMPPYLTSHLAFPSISVSIRRGLLAKEKRQYESTPGLTLLKAFLSQFYCFCSQKCFCQCRIPMKPGLFVELASREWKVLMSFRPLTITTHFSAMYKEILLRKQDRIGLESKSQYKLCQKRSLKSMLLSGIVSNASQTAPQPTADSQTAHTWYPKWARFHPKWKTGDTHPKYSENMFAKSSNVFLKIN